MLLRSLWIGSPCLLATLCLLSTSLSTITHVWGQPAAASSDSMVELIVEGYVEGVFRSAGRFDDTQLVQLALKSVSLEKLANLDAPVQGFRIPAPGEVVYVVIHEEGRIRERLQNDRTGVPQDGQSIRAVLRSEGRGVWSAEGRNWYETITSSRDSSNSDKDQARSPVGQSPLVSLRGMTCKTTLVGGQLGLEVTQVEEGPSQRAGFQVGDVVLAVNGQPVVSAASVQELVDQPTPLELTVIDVNTGRSAVVTVATAPRNTSGRPLPDDARPGMEPDPASRISTALGIAVEPTRVGFRRAVKVSRVTPTEPGAEAGLELGDVIVAVNGKRISDSTEFASALSNQTGPISLIVRDVRSGREVPIEVRAEGVARATPDTGTPASRPPAAARAAGQLGIVGELAFYKAEAAVKVVEVVPRSPASRAGIQPGWLILEADGTPLLHPDDLAKAEQSAAGRLRLRVVDPTSGRESSIHVDL